MNNPDTIKFYINATWYGDSTEWYSNFQTETQFTDDQIKAFFDTDNNESFGYAIMVNNLQNVFEYDCT